jgi:hypothetical protein
MSVPFPAIKPTGRSVRLGTYPTRTYRSLSGTTIKRSFGNKPHSYEIDLDFSNVTDDITIQILNHYNTTQGGFNKFKLPNAVFAGMSSDLRQIAEDPDNIRWEYSGPPTVDAVPPSLSNVRVTLIGEQRR